MGTDELVRGILLDIEGTTSSIRFVFDTMFPYVREHLVDYLESHAAERSCIDACEQIARDDEAGASLLSGFGGPLTTNSVRQKVAAHVLDLMDRDVKATGLKQLQGLIWESGFQSGALSAHVYPDVLPKLRQWREAGKRMWIYSSGSVHAQKLFFGHTIEGNLLEFFDGHWDTQVGGKKEASSYRAIAKQVKSEAGIEPDEMMFLSDVPDELDAASGAGLNTRLVIRPGNHPVAESCEHVAITSFDQLD